MTPSKDRLRRLLKAYADGTATPEEESQLWAWAAEQGSEAILREQVLSLLRSGEEMTPPMGSEALYDSIRRACKPPRKKKVFPWLRVAAAFFCLVLGLWAALTWREPGTLLSRPAGAMKISAQPSIKPGTRKATLRAGSTTVLLGGGDPSFSLAGNAVQIRSGKVRVAEVRTVHYTLSTPLGGEYQLVLDDGTLVWLNAGSNLTYPSRFSDSIREVQLEGEGYFEVQPDARRPFIVHASDQRIQVLGTAFNVQAYANEPENVTTLVQGSVMVRAGHDALRLRPGEQCMSDHHMHLKRQMSPSVKEATAWKNGYFLFEDADIRSIMRQLARWYDLDVEYADGLPDQSFGAILSRENDIGDILDVLEKTGAVHFRIQGRHITVTP